MFQGIDSKKKKRLDDDSDEDDDKPVEVSSGKVKEGKNVGKGAEQVDLLDFDAGAAATGQPGNLLDLLGGEQPGQASNAGASLLDLGSSTPA